MSGINVFFKLISLILMSITLFACSAPKKQYISYAASSPIPENSLIVIEASQSNPIEFRGEMTIASKANAGTMLYPGGAGLVGFVAGIATHAAVSSGVSNSQQNAEIEKANEVLKAIQPSLDKININDLLSHSSLTQGIKLVDNENLVNDKTITMQLSPMVKIAQDYSTIRLQNIVKINSKNKEYYQNLIEVSSPIPSNEDGQPLTSDETLLFTTQELFSKSLELALRDAKGQLEAISPMQTFKFKLGQEMQYQRAKLVFEDCN